ncbi:Integrase catalytic domain-containing protein [Trichostrongylus colubriformis]|uniref:Integrase catalytic domain-containing protein n=1 Tax=Trichostrongylus colubriformis TaxID=6319 RepID=A0AAN8EU95_TRICO
MARRWFLFYLMLVYWIGVGAKANVPTMQMFCTDKGVLVTTTQNNVTFEICTDNLCKRYDSGKPTVLATFPPEYTLQDYRVTLKWNRERETATMETVCKALDFCENVDCWLCAQVLFNPECWPIGAIATVMIILYFFVATCYLLLYVPMTIGKPIRLLLYGIHLLLAFIVVRTGWRLIKLIRNMANRRDHIRRRRMLIALAILFYLTTPLPYEVTACQQVDVFEHQSTVCSLSKKGQTCNITTTELLKLNTFKREACLRVLYNSTLVSNVKVRWEGLYLNCEQEMLYFTRPALLKVLDSKRCPHMGSCTGEKCANINSTTLIPELKEANRYPGRTGCFESCGGFGCDCFYLSSGCLFYRIFAVPTTTTVYGIFRCTRWSQQVKLEVTVENFHYEKGKQQHNVMIKPNIPVQLPAIRLTMTSVSLPPTPLLHSHFITNGQETSIWDRDKIPNLICASQKDAVQSNCSIAEDCRCAPAESKIKCECSTINVEEEFNHLEAKLPIKSAAWELATRKKDNKVIAKIPDMVSADITINFRSTLDIVSLIIYDDHCTVENAVLHGCYRCSQGAQSTIRCTSDRDTLGEILCGQDSFVVPCSQQSPESLLRFNFDTARQLLKCTISCGSITNSFVITGVLKYTGRLSIVFASMLEGNSTTYNTFQWPDISHVVDVILNWYKTLLFGLAVLALVLLLSYIYLPTVGLRMCRLLTQSVLTLLGCPLKVMVHLLRKLRGHRQGQHNSLRGKHEKVF